jgi:hypothetical protein
MNSEKNVGGLVGYIVDDLRSTNLQIEVTFDDFTDRKVTAVIEDFDLRGSVTCDLACYQRHRCRGFIRCLYIPGAVCYITRLRPDIDSQLKFVDISLCIARHHVGFLDYLEGNDWG